MGGTGREDVMLLCVSPSRSDGILLSGAGHASPALQQSGGMT